MATRFAVEHPGNQCVRCGDGWLLARASPLRLVHTIRGAAPWCIQPGRDRVAWLHESHELATWAPADCSWLVHVAPR